MITKTKTDEKEWARRTVGGSTQGDREDRARVLDGYGTPAVATRALLKRVRLSKNIWEPANGKDAISTVLREHGHKVYTSDVFKWCKATEHVRAFQDYAKLPLKDCDIVTNPPFKHAQMFVEHGMGLLRKGGKLCLLLRVQFLEGKRRKKMFEESGLRTMHIFSGRLPRMHRFGFKGEGNTSAMAFAWFVFEKGYDGKPEIEWV